MGTGFFKGKSQVPKIGGGNTNLEARALAAPGYAGRQAGSGQQKDVAAAKAIYKAHPLKPGQRDAAYGPGPKKV